MSWSRIQSNKAAAASVAFPGDITAGNLLVLMTSDGSTGGDPSDGRGNIWLSHQFYAGGQNIHSYLAIAASSGPCTVSFGGLSFQGMVIAEYAYSGGAWAYYGGLEAHGISTTHPTGNMDCLVADSLAIGMFGSDDGNAGAVSAGGAATLVEQTPIVSSANDRVAMEELAVGIETVNLSWAMSNCSGSSHLLIVNPVVLPSKPDDPDFSQFPKPILRRAS